MKITIPPTVRAALDRLRAAGFAAYAVGGCVRDSLLGKTPQDWDICTDAKPEETAACFAEFRTLLTGARYGTVTVLYNGMPLEITTFRSDGGYSDSRHPDSVRFLDSLQGDLSRRDFTVNAMAADSSGAVVDCFDGISDLKRGVIRSVGDPRERFAEDALRMLRALRFGAKLGFSVAPDTAAAIHARKEDLKAVAPERLRKELSGLLCAKDAGRLAAEFADVLCVLLPELMPCVGFRQYNPHHAFDVWRHTLAALEAAEPEEALRWATLLHDIGKPSVFQLDKRLIGHFYGHAIVSAAMCEAVLRRLRFDSESIRLITTLVREHELTVRAGEERRMCRLLSRLGEPTVRLLLRLRRADRLGQGTRQAETVEEDTRETEALLERVLQEQRCFSLAQLAVNGDDLLALGVKRGPVIGRLLRELLEAVIAQSVPNEREKLIQYVQKMAEFSEND